MARHSKFQSIYSLVPCVKVCGPALENDIAPRSVLLGLVDLHEGAAQGPTEDSHTGEEMPLEGQASGVKRNIYVGRLNLRE